MVGSVANLLRGLRLDPIQHPGHNEFHGLPHDSKNGDGNEQADNWIGFRITEVDSKSADKDCKTGPSISSGVVPICSEGGTTNLTANPNPKDSNSLVTEKAYDGRDDDGHDVSHGSWMEKSFDRLIKRYASAGEYDEYEGQASQILYAAKPIIKSSGWLPLGKKKSDTKGNRSRRIAEVMNRVR